MESNEINYSGREYFNNPVPDLLNDPNYLRELNNPHLSQARRYCPIEDFQKWQKNRVHTREIKELVETIDNKDEYKYSNASIAFELFHDYLVVLTKLKDYLLPDGEGRFRDGWLEKATEFQIRCEEIFIHHVKDEYISSFLPLVPRQLEYTSMRIKAAFDMDETELDYFRNLFVLIALGFIGKLKLLSFYLSLSIAENPKLNPNFVVSSQQDELDTNIEQEEQQYQEEIEGKQDQYQEQEQVQEQEREREQDTNTNQLNNDIRSSTYESPCYDMGRCDTNQTTLSSDDCFSGNYNTDFSQNMGTNMGTNIPANIGGNTQSNIGANIGMNIGNNIGTNVQWNSYSHDINIDYNMDFMCNSLGNFSNACLKRFSVDPLKDNSRSLEYDSGVYYSNEIDMSKSVDGINELEHNVNNHNPNLYYEGSQKVYSMRKKRGRPKKKYGKCADNYR